MGAGREDRMKNRREVTEEGTGRPVLQVNFAACASYSKRNIEYVPLLSS